MGKVIMHPKCDDPSAVWPGDECVNREGYSIAYEMLCELEDSEWLDKDGTVAADLSCLENWPRQGKPFRNVVAEYLARARAVGPEVETGFCAVLSDFVAGASGGTVWSACRYEHIEE